MEPAQPSEIVIHRGSGTGARQYTIGRVTRAMWSPRHHPQFTTPDQRELPNGQLSGLVVPVETDTEYWSSDGLSFGVEADCGWVYMARCRAATDDEVAAAVAETAAANVERVRKAEQKARRRELFSRASAQFSSGWHLLPDSDRVDAVGAGAVPVPVGPESERVVEAMHVDETAGLVWTVDSQVSRTKSRLVIYEHRLTDERREIVAALRAEYS